jgi:hypothetical protein
VKERHSYEISVESKQGNVQEMKVGKKKRRGWGERRKEVRKEHVLYKVFIFPSNTYIITIKSIYKATCFGPIGPSSGLTIRTGVFTASTFWDPRLFT